MDSIRYLNTRNQERQKGSEEDASPRSLLGRKNSQVKKLTHIQIVINPIYP
jgi:hypothetical protein